MNEQMWVLIHRSIGGKRGPDEVLGVFRSPEAAAGSELAKELIGCTQGYRIGWLPKHVSVSPERPDPDVVEFSWSIDGEMERLTITRFEVRS